MNATTKDLARIATSVALQAVARGSGGDAEKARPISPRTILHGAMTIILGIAVVALAVGLSNERNLRSLEEAQFREIAVARPPNARADQQQAGWALRAALAARIGSAASGAAAAAAAAAVTTARAPSGSRDQEFQQQLRQQLANPALRSAFRSQQRSAVLQLYGELLRSWHMSADKSDRVLDLLAEQELQQTEQSLNANDPGSTRSSKPVPDPKAAASNDELDALLSDAQRRELQRQQDNLSERLIVGSLADELSLAQMPLTDSQRDQLTQAMVDERKSVPVPDIGSVPANSPEAQRELKDWQSALEQRVQDRAAMILTSAQQTRYEQFMTREREARNAFATFEVAQSGDNGSGATPPGATQPGATPP